MDRKKVTVLDLQQAKNEGRKITMITAYDYIMAQLGDLVGMDMLLVGDSGGMVFAGMDSTVPVTMEHMIYHTQAVVRGCKGAHIVTDLPFMSYNTSIRDAIINGGRLIKEGGADSVKLEGGEDYAETVAALVKAGIPVQAHIGLTPQTIGMLGGFKAQGRDAASAKKIMIDALAMEDAGAYSIVMEAVPAELAKLVAGKVQIPIIGIGAGPYVDGQVLVTPDLLGMFDRFVPKFAKQYAQLRPMIMEAFQNYAEEVRQGVFPHPVDHSFSISPEALEAVRQLVEED